MQAIRVQVLMEKEKAWTALVLPTDSIIYNVHRTKATERAAELGVGLRKIDNLKLNES